MERRWRTSILLTQEAHVMPDILISTELRGTLIWISSALYPIAWANYSQSCGMAVLPLLRQ